MMTSLYLKTLYDKRWFMFSWFVGLGLMGVLITTFYTAMNQEGSLDTLVKNMPTALQGMVGNLADLREFSTYLASQLFDIRAVFMGGVMAVILGTSLSISEEEKGELRTLISLPLSRDAIVIQKFLAMMTIVAIVLLGLVPGILIGQTFIDETVATNTLVRLLFMNWLLLVALGSIVLGTGFATGRRAITMTIAIVVAAGGFIMSTFSQAVDWLKPYDVVSLIHYFPSVDIAKTGIQAGDIIVLTTVTIISILATLVVFRRRDIA